MLQVIVLASIATVVLMAVLFAAAAAVQESVERDVLADNELSHFDPPGSSLPRMLRKVSELSP